MAIALMGLLKRQGRQAQVDRAAFQIGNPAQAFERRIRDIDEIIDCHLMTGDTDYLLRVVKQSRCLPPAAE